MDLELQILVCTGLYRFKQDMVRPFLNSSREMEHNQTKFHSSKLHFNIYSTITTVRDNKIQTQTSYRNYTFKNSKNRTYLQIYRWYGPLKVRTACGTVCTAV